MFSFIKTTLRSSLDSLLDFVYPPLCISCGKLLESGRDHVCSECWSSIRRVETSPELFSETRGKLVASGIIDELASLYVFEKEGVLQKIVHSLKYSGAQAVGIELGRLLGQMLMERRITGNVLVPIPLHKRKLRERGYNQSELIARGLSERTGVPLRTDLVRRTRFTQTQTALSLGERKKNMEDAFEYRSPKAYEVKGKTIVLIDDIITTGSTVVSCAEILKRAGAREIIAASAALAQKDTVERA
jgi:ComF family protein